MNNEIVLSHVIPSMSRKHRKLMEGKISRELLNVKFQMFDSIPEIFPKLSDPKFKTDFIVIDLEHLCGVEHVECFEVISALRTLINCTVCRATDNLTIRRKTTIIGLVGGDTDIKLIKSAVKVVDRLAVRDSGGWTSDDALEDCKKYISGDLSVPKLIQDLLKKKKIKAKESNEIILTPRQQQIFDIIVNRGSSNKQVAKIIGISESTVKLHIGHIFKKYGVKNRTQLAVFSKELKQQ